MNGEGNDELINDEQIAKEMEFEKLCASGDCSSMPAKQKMQIKVGVIFQNAKKFLGSQETRAPLILLSLLGRRRRRDID